MVDYSYFILIPAVLLAFIAQAAVQGNYKKYARVAARCGCTGAQVARALLDGAGLWDVPVQQVRGELTDHYDPRKRVLCLSAGVYDSPSLAALGIAAHEVGHALQHRDAYAPLRLRNTLVPVAQVASHIAWPMFLVGMFLSFGPLAYAGVFLFAGAVLFQLVTLPVEFNASARAMAQLQAGGYLQGDETRGAKKVLRSAAMTYVAAALMAILQLVRLLALVGGGRRRK